MRKNKRGGEDLTRSSHGNRRAKRATMISKESHEGIEETIQISGNLHGDSNQDVLAELSDEVKSNMSKSVASLAVCSGDYTLLYFQEICRDVFPTNITTYKGFILHSVGDTLLFACSGIAIERELYVTKFVTSPKLALVFNSARIEKKHDNVKIEVRHVGSEVYQGFLDSDDVDEHFSVVKVKTFLDVNVGLIEHAEGILPYGKVVVLGRGTSGELMAKSVILAGDDWEGMEKDPHMRCSIAIKTEAATCSGSNPCARKMSVPPWSDFSEFQVYKTGIEHSLFGDVDKMGYPKLPVTMLDDGLVLVNTFEDTFGDVWGEGVWRELGKNASDISRIVVALASFNGNFTPMWHLPAGIGGPLFNMRGEIIGMNFYSEKIGTPFLLWNEIGNILAYFKEKSDAGEVAKDSGSSFWKMDGDDRVRLNRDEPNIEIPPGEEFRYGYIGGTRYRNLVEECWVPMTKKW
ncbi:hypothetical protein TRIUR3_18591 [Triticum urartu]|uniref:Uncharacterized protein n=1 Tax=Triticum urartu TaxID=4572 RepID=M7ZKY7_TRIUA|nr:hypothetical protein TRIUR3_18591 [Triticum urartu]